MNFPGQFRADARDPNLFIIRSRIAASPSANRLESVETSSYKNILLPIESRTSSFVGVDVSFGTLPEGHVNTTIYATTPNFNNYLHFVKNQVNCRHCFSVKIHTKPLKGSFGFIVRPHLLKNFLSFDLSPFDKLDRVLPTTNWTSTSTGRVKFKYSLDVEIASKNVSVSATSRVGDSTCNLKGLLDWKAGNSTVENQYRSKLNLACMEQLAAELSLVYNVSEDETLKIQDIALDHSFKMSNLIDYAENVTFRIKTNEQLLKHLTFSRSNCYNLSKSQFNEAIHKKFAQTHMQIDEVTRIARHDGAMWSYPAYKVVARGRIPFLKLLEGGGERVYNHTGVYFMDRDVEENLHTTCDAEAECEEEYQEIIKVGAVS